MIDWPRAYVIVKIGVEAIVSEVTLAYKTLHKDA